MIQIQNTKALVVNPAFTGTVATNNTTGNSFDTIGYHYATIISTQSVPTASSNSANFSTFTVQKGPTSTGPWTDVLVASTVTTSDYVLPADNQTSTANQTIRADIAMDQKDRYLNFIAAPKNSNTRQFATMAILSRAEQGPPPVTNDGVDALYVVQ